MARGKGMFVVLSGLVLSVSLVVQSGITVQAGSKNYLDELNGGVAAILESSEVNTAEVINATAKELNLELTQKEKQSDLVMANVKNALNVRSEASEDSEKVGKLYKDCGGTVLERKDGWTKLQSGNLIGWAKDEYLLFDEDAKALANDVGKTLVISLAFSFKSLIWAFKSFIRGISSLSSYIVLRTLPLVILLVGEGVLFTLTLLSMLSMVSYHFSLLFSVHACLRLLYRPSLLNDAPFLAGHSTTIFSKKFY